MSSTTAAIVGPGGNYQPDREVSNEDDPDLGAVALEDDIIGGSDGGGGSEEGGGVETWPDDVNGKDESRLAWGAVNTGAGPSVGPSSLGGKRKRKQGAALFGSVPKRPKNPAATTRRKEAAAKVAKF